MTISELSDSALSEWIAEKLEPACDNSRFRFRVCYADGHWEPCDFVGDAEMTVMLLERMKQQESVALFLGEKGNWVGIRAGEVSAAPYAVNDLFDHSVYFSRMRISHRAQTLGRAAAEAFALANGWKP